MTKEEIIKNSKWDDEYKFALLKLNLNAFQKEVAINIELMDYDIAEESITIESITSEMVDTVNDLLNINNHFVLDH